MKIMIIVIKHQRDPNQGHPTLDSLPKSMFFFPHNCLPPTDLKLLWQRHDCSFPLLRLKYHGIRFLIQTLLAKRSFLGFENQGQAIVTLSHILNLNGMPMQNQKSDSFWLCKMRIKQLICRGK